MSPVSPVSPVSIIWLLFSSVGAALLLGSAAVLLIRRRLGPDHVTGQNLVDRTVGWAWIIGTLAVAFALGRWAVALLLAFAALQGLRELLSRRGLASRQDLAARHDYASLALLFYGVLPVLFLLTASSTFARFSPWLSFGGLALACGGSIRLGRSRDLRFRLAVLANLLGLAHLSALLWLPSGQGPVLLGFLLLVVQVSDIAQYLSGRLLGRHALSSVSPGKTWEGVMGGLVAATALGFFLQPLMPFSRLQAAHLAFLTTLLGILGGQLLSWVKRDLGLKDWGRLIPGHGGMLDRVDSLLLAAPVYYHLIRALGL